MPKKRAFVRYTKSGEIVPGSLIVTTNGGYPDKTSLWQEVSVDKCCGDICSEPSQLFCTENWAFENFDGTSFRNGDPIPQVTNAAAWAALTTPGWSYYLNNTVNGRTYGKLYNWYAVNDPRGLAPEGWRVPSLTDWQKLITCVGGIENAGNKLKTTGEFFSNTGLWQFDSGTTNEYGFSGLPAGLRADDGSFSSLSEFGFWWTSTEIDTNKAYVFWAKDNFTNLTEEIYTPKKYGMSVRLIKDI